jgi:hypothetical protein
MTIEVHLMGPDKVRISLKQSTMLATREYLILRAMVYKDLNSATVIECNSYVGNNVKGSHLCMNPRVGLWISLNLILVV